MSKATTDSIPRTVPFIDLQAQRRRLGSSIEVGIKRVLESGRYILGPEVKRLEDRLNAFCGAKHSITCASGTDALVLVLRAKGVGAGDAVIVPSFTFAATAEAVCVVGATPVFVDVLPDTFNMDPEDLERGIETARNAGLTARAVISVDLFGQPADYEALEPIVAAHGLWLICDAAQSFGAVYKTRRVGTIGLATTTSFFPAKPLGCYGDGGAIFTEDDGLASTIRSLRVHGQGKDKYDNIAIGLNSRLDTMQAAILLAKLEIFELEITARQTVAQKYAAGLGPLGPHVVAPDVAPGLTSVWAQYTVKLSNTDRSRLAADLKSRGIPTAVYYGKPLHQQTAYCAYPKTRSELAVSEDLAARVLSLPMHPYLETDLQAWIIEQFEAALASESALAG